MSKWEWLAVMTIVLGVGSQAVLFLLLLYI